MEVSCLRPLVTVITPNLNGKAHLEHLLASLASQSYPADRVEVIVVDNGSSDDSIAYLTAHHPHVRLIRNATNEGFARPNNQAAAVAQGQYLALLNNDMKLASDWIERMVSLLEASPADVACIGSRILSWDGSAIDFIKGEMAFNGMGMQPAYGARVDSLEASRYPDDILFACGGALLIKRDVYLEAGGFDEDYFAYYEDVDLGWRLWVLGYRVRLCPEAVVYHLHNGTSKRFDGWRKSVLFERNAMFSVLKNYEDASLASIWPATLLLAFKRTAVRSEINRESFRFGPPPPKASAQGAVLQSPIEKVLANLTQHGLGGTGKKIAVALARKILQRWGRPGDLQEATVPISREAYAVVVGMEDTIDFLPRILAKRAEIQARRKRSDAEIASLFGDALTPIEGRGDYLAAHWQVVRELELTTLFGREEPARP